MITTETNTITVVQDDQWTEVIVPHTRLLDIPFAEIWRYRDLLLLLVRRDFVATYKQTILGPVWFFLQPILTTVMFSLIFGKIASLSTEGMPMLLFYMSGITLWNYFSECLTKTATVFKDNEAVFGKVYFPRLIMPLSIVVSNLVKLGIQTVLFLLLWIYYLLNSSVVHPNAILFFFPLLVLIMAGLSLGFGMLISAMTTKYRDLVFLISFGIQLLMYATPVIYPLSSIGEKYRWLIKANPLSGVIETFRYGFLGSGAFEGSALLYSTFFMVAILCIGVIVFNRVEKSFMDTV